MLVLLLLVVVLLLLVVVLLVHRQKKNPEYTLKNLLFLVMVVVWNHYHAPP
jgi:hypothetical protein